MVVRFTQGITYSTYKLLVSKIRDILQKNCIIKLKECYSALRSEEIWINEQSVRVAQASNGHQVVIGAFNITNKPSNDRTQRCGGSIKSFHENVAVKVSVQECFKTIVGILPKKRM